MPGSTAVAIRDDQITFDDLQVKALTHLGVQNADKADLAVFFHTCKRTGLDPFARQIYMIARQSSEKGTDGQWRKVTKQTIQTGIDGFRLIAQRTTERTKETFGYEDTLWCGEDGQWRDVWLSKEPPAASKVVVIRNGQRFPNVALFHEYVQTDRNGNPTKTWAEKSALMLAKCAEAGALRKAFPQDLSGVYTADEIPVESAPETRQQRVSAADFTVRPPAEIEQAVDGQDPEPVDVTGWPEVKEPGQ